MTTDTLTLTAFLLKRIEEDEARAASDIDHFCDPNDNADKWITMYAKRLAAECAAKRAIVERAEMILSSWYATDRSTSAFPDVNRRERSHAEANLYALATVYAAHRDFNPAWA